MLDYIKSPPNDHPVDKKTHFVVPRNSSRARQGQVKQSFSDFKNLKRRNLKCTARNVVVEIKLTAACTGP